VAPPLKDLFGPDVPVRIAEALRGAGADLDVDAFVAECLDGYAGLELTPRGRRIAAVMARHLPAGFPAAADLVERSLGPPVPEQRAGTGGMDLFLYLPHTYWVAGAGLDHPERALALQHALTRRFTAEFSIRAYIERHPETTMATLRRWTRDPSAHVRRLVSEGTRPRLPWATRLRGFQRDPSPVLPLLEALRDDPSEYVRRSVANNLNDIGRDNPDVLLATASRWMGDAGPARRRLVRHALRSLTRAGDPRALAILGMEPSAALRMEDLRVEPADPAIGGRVRITCRVVNAGPGTAGVVVHARIGFVTARGGVRERTFAMGEAVLGPGEGRTFGATVSLAQHTTRTHHAGLHPVTVAVNGEPRAEAAFTLRPGDGVP
jgi:3-methyladenine DNA glycosylase AlkC